MDIEAKLFALQDIEYRGFVSKLLPNVDKESILGVRTPDMRALAKELEKSPSAQTFLLTLPHKYYEENNLHGFLISRMRDFDACVAALDAFLPYVNNWATCDLISPKMFRKHLPELEAHIKRWIASEKTYTTRFGIEMLMSFYLDEAFRPELLDWVVAARSEEYYVRMMVAWFFATALAKQWSAAIPVLEKKLLAPWTHNKTIQKARESYRITAEQKEYLSTLRIPKKQG